MQCIKKLRVTTKICSSWLSSYTAISTCLNTVKVSTNGTGNQQD